MDRLDKLKRSFENRQAELEKFCQEGDAYKKSQSSLPVSWAIYEF